MRPKLLTPRSLILGLLAATIFSALALWLMNGMPLPGRSVPSTAGKLAFVSNRGGNPDIWMMDSADGGNAVALTSDKAEDRSPAWSPDGSEVAFVSGGRTGITPQIFRMDARPGARPTYVTKTSSTKYAPDYGPEKQLYFMDTGKLVAVNTVNNDPTAILPPADLRVAMASYLAQGGFDKIVPSADGSRFLAAMKLEQGEALVLFVPGENLLAMLGVAEEVYGAFQPDGGMIAVFLKGAPSQPIPLLNDAMLHDPNFKPLELEQFRPPSETSMIVRYDSSLNMAGEPEPVPFVPNDLAFSPDASKIAFAFSDSGGQLQGVYVVPVGVAGEVKPVFEQSARSPVWSPDGSQLAFIHENDIYVAPADGGEAKNLTNGQGVNSEPAWSPARPKDAR